MSYEKINKALEEKYGKPQDYSFEQLIAMQKEAQESGLADQLKAMVLNEARALPANPSIPEGTDPFIASLAKTQPEVAQKLIKFQETQRQLSESMADFKSSGPSMK